jgi:hypothetical protein
MKKFFFIPLLLVLLASCSTQEDFSGNRNLQDSIDMEDAARGTYGTLIPITSSNVMAAGYDMKSLTMTVQFKNGLIYEYYGVDLELWNSFLSAQPDPWSTIGYPRLVGEGYKYRRIN